MTITARITVALACSAGLVAAAMASPPSHMEHGSHATAAPTMAPYAGQDARAVSSLSAADVDALLAGQGWGLAKPAEFNGYPGPSHVLELAADLQLSEEQRQRVKLSFDRMKARALELGAKYVEAERAIDDAFRTGDAAGVIADRIAAAERLRVALRLVHLDAHLEITPLLTPDQRQRYADLRGYTGGAAEHGQHKH